MEPAVEARIAAPVPLDLMRTLAPLRHGRGDPTIRLTPAGLWRATRTTAGPATLQLRAEGGELVARAWGPGAAMLIAATAELVGGSDDPTALVPAHLLVRQLQGRLVGLRLGRTGAVFEALLPAIIEQKVTGEEARASYRALIRRFGEPAPGPAGLMIGPDPVVLARLPYWAYHPLGLEQRRADTIRRAAAEAPGLEAAAGLTGAGARATLARLPGIGPWTAAEAVRVALGDPDAVSVGDYHVPSLVSWALAGEPRANDARMLELLEPYRGQRARVVRLLEAAGIRPPRAAPRMSPRRIAGL